MKLIILNGPPGSGKDTAAKIVCDYIRDNSRVLYHHIKQSAPLKDAIHALYGLSVPTGEFEDRKDTPCSEFFEQEPRELYIAMWEYFTKPILGPLFLQNIFIRKCREIDAYNMEIIQQETIFVCSDSGFQDELDCLIEEFGRDNIILLQLERAGKDFSRDSRSYITGDCAVTRIRNDAGLLEFSEAIIKWLHTYLQEQYGADY